MLTMLTDPNDDSSSEDENRFEDDDAESDNLFDRLERQQWWLHMRV